MDDIWAKVKNQHLVKDIVNENKDLTNSNLFDYNEFLHTNKEIIRSELKITKPLAPNKPLGSAGDITTNDLINKGVEIVDTPLVQTIRENVDVTVVGTYLTSMIIYKTIVNLYVKSAYSTTFTDIILSAPSTRSKEIALFLLIGAPFVVGCMWSGNKIVGGKLIVNVVSNNELEGTSSSSFFLFLNKLPSWLKAILKYIAFYFIGLFIVNVIGYKSNIIRELSSQSNVYLLYFLKIWAILNFLVIIYFIWKLYVIVMFANNKEYLNPEDYPKILKNELIESKDIAINLYLKDPGKVYKHYLKLIFLYSTIVFFGFIVIVLHSIYVIP